MYFNVSRIEMIRETFVKSVKNKFFTRKFVLAPKLAG